MKILNSFIHILVIVMSGGPVSVTFPNQFPNQEIQKRRKGGATQTGEEGRWTIRR